MSTKESLPSTPILETNPCETIDLGTRDDRHFQDEPETLDLWTERRAIQKQLEEAQEELRDVKARLVALQNTVEVLQDDKEKLVREKRVLREENDQLKEDINNYRSNRSKATTEISSIAQPPVPKEKSRRDDIKVRRSESKRRGEDTDRDTLKRRKESERLHEEDKKRLYARFDHHDPKSYDSGIGSTSGSSRRSHIERDSSTAPRSSAESPRRMRADSSYSQIRPQVVATTKYRDHEGSTVFYDDTYAEAGGKYHAYPLASPVQWRERRRRDSPHAGADGDYRPDPYPLASPVPWRGRRRRDSPHAGAHGDYLPYPLASPATKPETQSATALADICLRKFGDCCSQRALEANHWIENRQADFNLWISRMIEFRDLVGGSSSSEFGLDTRPRELSLVKNLLTNLGSHLSNCEATSEGDFLKESKQNVDSAIQNLALLAIAIRQTASKARRLKVGEASNLPALADLRTHLECLIVVGTTASKEDTRQLHEKQPLWRQDHSSGSLTPLQQRLVEANLQRRLRFLAAQQSSNQISCQPALSHVHVGQTMSSIASATDKILPPSSKEKNSASPPAPSISPRPGFQPSLPITSPEASTSFTTGISIDNESQNAETPQTQRSFIRTATNYPRLAMPRPQIEGDGHEKLHGATVLKCPCCCETLPYSMLEDESLWKDHLAADIDPYTCIAEDCPRPNVLYRSVAKWKAHVRKHHAKTWNCQLCDESDMTIYTSHKQLSKHVRDAHTDSFPEQLLGTVSLWPCSISVGLDACPLCSVAGPRDSPVLIRHILEHIHDFSLRSLPWADMPMEYIQGSTTSGIYDLSYLELSEAADSSAPMLPWMMNFWFEKLELPESEQWAQAESALNDLILRRSVHKGVGNESYFSRNDYFASDSGHVSLDVKLDESPSLRSYGSDSSFGCENHEDTDEETFEGNTQSEDEEDGRAAKHRRPFLKTFAMRANTLR